MLAKAKQEGKIGGVRICRTTPSMSDLLFADDSLILCRATEEDAVHLRELLGVYEACSGQIINADKSIVLFSPNTGSTQRQRVRDILNIRSETRSEKYLGLHVSMGRARTDTFA